MFVMPDIQLPSVYLIHKRGDDERSDNGCTRATCSTCGWHGLWRRGGWEHRDWHWHHEDAYHAAMNQVWEGRAVPADPMLKVVAD